MDEREGDEGSPRPSTHACQRASRSYVEAARGRHFPPNGARSSRTTRHHLPRRCRSSSFFSFSLSTEGQHETPMTKGRRRRCRRGPTLARWSNLFDGDSRTIPAEERTPAHERAGAGPSNDSHRPPGERFPRDSTLVQEQVVARAKPFADSHFQKGTSRARSRSRLLRCCAVVAVPLQVDAARGHAVGSSSRGSTGTTKSRSSRPAPGQRKPTPSARGTDSIPRENRSPRSGVLSAARKAMAVKVATQRFPSSRWVPGDDLLFATFLRRDITLCAGKSLTDPRSDSHSARARLPR